MRQYILGSADQATMLASYWQLGSQHPPIVHKYVAATLRTDGSLNEGEKHTRKLGIQPPTR